MREICSSSVNVHLSFTSRKMHILLVKGVGDVTTWWGLFFHCVDNLSVLLESNVPTLTLQLETRTESTNINLSSNRSFL